MEHLDEILGIIVPIIVYWIYAGFYEVLGSLERFQKYRIHSRSDQEAKNKVSKRDAVKGALIQHFIQATVISLSYMVTQGRGSPSPTTHAAAHNADQPSLLTLARQILIAMIVVDTHMYFVHRLCHTNKFLYRHIHSVHHQLIVPYAFAAQHGHPLESTLADTVAGTLGYLASGMSPRTSIFFFTFTVMKTVDDHCGMRLPWNVFHLLFWNNTAYHDVHHFYGHRYNYAQPFFVAWDKIMGTHMPCKLEKREGGGFLARVLE